VSYERSLILLRGLPGAGKSTLAGVLAEGKKYPVFSVDSYFYSGEEGKYEFRFRENHLAYKKCEDDTGQAMKQGIKKIFVDNTFTLEWEMEPYFKLASEFAYRIYVVTVEHRHGGKNIHGIDEESLKRMAEKYKVVLI
jgi:predicted kinase